MVKPKWPKRLVIVRHGQSEQNAALDLLEKGLDKTLKRLRQTSDYDIALTDQGIFQAQQTGEYLASSPQFDVCFSSPYKRAMQTAEAIVSRLSPSLRFYIDERLREKEFGKLHGLTTEEIKAKYPEEYADRKRDGKYWYRLPRGENYLDVRTRVHSFLDKLTRKYGGKSVLLVTHQVPYVLFRAEFEHLSGKGVLALGDVPNCGIEEFVLDTSKVPEGRMKLKDYNVIGYEEE